MSSIRSFNVDPYYDDFDPNKDFHQILFRPGVSVQTRELNQIQSIIKDQIKKFGDHVFQQGSIVIPGNSFSDLNVSYIKLQNNFLGSPINVDLFNGKIVVGVISGVEALVRHVEVLTEDDPNTLYVNYQKAGTDGAPTFVDGEELFLKENISIRATMVAEDAIGIGSLAFINQGVYYVNGNFVRVEKQATVLERYGRQPSCHVLLKIVESIVSADDDQSLLDPAQGTYNYAAPGADRFKVSLDLMTLPLGSAITDDYVEIMRYESGQLMEHAKTARYSELEKSLARRTYDESGDYVVEGFIPSLYEHIKLPKNKGLYPPPEGDRNKFVVQLTPGKAYIRGFEVEKISPTNIVADKARTLDHIKNKQAAVVASYGQTLYVQDLIQIPNFASHQEIELYNSDDYSNMDAELVGTANAYALDSSEYPGIYDLYIYDLSFEPGFGIRDIGGIRFAGAGSAKVLQKAYVPNVGIDFLVDETTTFAGRSGVIRYHDKVKGIVFMSKHDEALMLPVIGDAIIGGTSGAQGIMRDLEVVQSRGSQEAPIIEWPLRPLTSVRDVNGDPDIRYQVKKYLVINTDPSGNGSVTIDEGTIDPLNESNFVASFAGGEIAINFFSLNFDGSTLSITGGPTSISVKVQVTVTKNEIQEKTKTLTTRIESGVTLSGSIAKYHVLERADIFDIVSIVSSTEGDVTSRFSLDNGQRNYVYDYGRINLTGNEPSGTLTITYRYFQHSVTGDYFTVDSYRNSGIADPALLDFVDYIPQYYSTTLSRYFDLKSCIDFRKIVDDLGDPIVNNSRIVASVNYYVGRIDRYSLTKRGDIQYLRGIPDEEPEAPEVPEDNLLLATYQVWPWTGNINNINVKQEKNRRFTMKDINKLSERVDTLEYYSTLSALESDATNMEIIDATTGLSRYKTGYLVDNFSNPFLIADQFNPKFAATYDNAQLNPAQEWVQTSLDLLDSSTNYRKTGNYVTLPYVEVTFASQPFSTRITNVNPFLIFSWIGSMKLSPDQDSWVVTEDLPTIFNTVTNTINVSISETVQSPAIGGVAAVPSPGATPTQPPPALISFTDFGGDFVGGNESGAGMGGDGGGDGGGDCFTPDTLVVLADGSVKRIDQIQIGDYVLSNDEITSNRVRFVEIVPATHWSHLYSPTSELKPFATINHPMYDTDGKLKAFDKFKTLELYPWLDVEETFENVVYEKTSDTLVYNLWVEGDGTYIVNGFGTHSIVFDGYGLVDLHEKGYLRYQDVLDATNEFTNRSSDVSMGALVLIKFIGKVRGIPVIAPVTNSFFAWYAKYPRNGKSTAIKSIIFGLTSIVGKIAKVLDK